MSLWETYESPDACVHLTHLEPTRTKPQVAHFEVTKELSPTGAASTHTKALVRACATEGEHVRECFVADAVKDTLHRDTQ